MKIVFVCINVSVFSLDSPFDDGFRGRGVVFPGRVEFVGLWLHDLYLFVVVGVREVPQVVGVVGVVID